MLEMAVSWFVQVVTEPLLRVMAEAPTDDEVNYYVDTIADVVRAEIGLD